VPQNRFTLDNSGVYFKTFEELRNKISLEDLESQAQTPVNLVEKYNWQRIVNAYQELY
jgi:hypothetical protein